MMVVNIHVTFTQFFEMIDAFKNKIIRNKFPNPSVIDRLQSL